MVNKIKALGLAFVAITAMSAMASSAAQASQVHVSEAPAVVTGHIVSGQQHILSIPLAGGGKLNAICDASTIEATLNTTTSQQVTVTPQYSTCKLAGTNATVAMNGCHYNLFSAGTPTTGATANATVICTPEKQIQIKTALCTVDVPAQENKAHVVFEAGQNGHVNAVATVGGLKATQTGAACPGGNGSQTEAASFSGSTTLTAFKDKEENHQVQRGDGHIYTEYTHGAGLQLLVT
jgi:hypothetical protein